MSLRLITNISCSVFALLDCGMFVFTPVLRSNLLTSSQLLSFIVRHFLWLEVHTTLLLRIWETSCRLFQHMLYSTCELKVKLLLFTPEGCVKMVRCGDTFHCHLCSQAESLRLKNNISTSFTFMSILNEHIQYVYIQYVHECTYKSYKYIHTYPGYFHLFKPDTQRSQTFNSTLKHFL